jgi:hypothetical protein
MEVDDEISVELQGRSCFAVEFPGYIENRDRALSTMGGIEGLQEQRKARPKTLTLKLRPEDDFCHPIVSNDAKKSSMMLLRLQDGVSSLCTVPLVYQFRSPADLQMQGGEGSFDDERAYCTPPVFQVEGPIEYAIDAYGFRKGKCTNGNVGLGMIALDYDIPYTPNDEAGYFDDNMQAMDTRLPRVGQILQNIFNKRPVYLNEALLLELKMKFPKETLSAADVNEQLMTLCYRFTSGPWRSSWVRKGYDPRKDMKSGKYHVISLIRDEESASSDEDHDRDLVTHDNYTEVCSLNFPAHGPSIKRVHLVDIYDQAIKERLKSSVEVPSRTCTEECGWHVEFALSKMADRIKDIVDNEGGTNISVSYHEAKDENKYCLDAFNPVSDIMDENKGQLPSMLTTQEATQFFDIIPNEYYDNIASNLIQKK